MTEPSGPVRHESEIPTDAHRPGRGAASSPPSAASTRRQRIDEPLLSDDVKDKDDAKDKKETSVNPHFQKADSSDSACSVRVTSSGTSSSSTTSLSSSPCSMLVSGGVSSAACGSGAGSPW